MKKYINATNMTKIFHFMALGLFCILFYYGLGVTGEEHEERWVEYITLKQNSIILNTAKLVIAVGVLWGIGKLFSRFFNNKTANIFLTIACLFSFLFSVYWINAAPAAPEADQMLVCQYAAAFNQGDFNGLKIGRYIARYPQQLGLVTFLRGLYYVFGEMNYRAFQYFAAATVPLCVFSGCQILRHITNNNRRAEMYYLLLVISCFPMYAYVPFVYGDLPSTAFGLLATWLLLSCMERFSVPKVIALGLVAGFAVQLRKNTLILLIAFGVVIIVKLFEKFRWQLIITGCSILIGTLLLQGALRILYYDEWDDTADAIPALLYVVMGFNDDYNRAGWHNGYEYHVFAVSNDDTEAALEWGRRDFASYMTKFTTEPDYALDFFSRKMNYQWNSPMYQCRVLNDNFDGQPDRLASTIFWNGRLGILLRGFMKIYQLLMYGSLLFLLIIYRKEKIAIEKYVLLIAVFGGFLFSMIWEAKTRYVFPYFLMMIPYYAIGVNAIIAYLEQKWKKKKGEAACLTEGGHFEEK